MRITTKETHDGTKFVLTVSSLELLALGRHSRDAGAQYAKAGRRHLAKEAYAVDEEIAEAYDAVEYGGEVLL